MQGRTVFSGLLDTHVLIEREVWNGTDWIGAGASALPNEHLEVELGELPRIGHTCEDTPWVPCPGCERIDA